MAPRPHIHLCDSVVPLTMGLYFYVSIFLRVRYSSTYDRFMNEQRVVSEMFFHSGQNTEFSICAAHTHSQKSQMSCEFMKILNYVLCPFL